MSQDGETVCVLLIGLIFGLLAGLMIGTSTMKAQIFEDIAEAGIHESSDRRIVRRVEEKEWPE